MPTQDPVSRGVTDDSAVEEEAEASEDRLTPIREENISLIRHPESSSSHFSMVVFSLLAAKFTITHFFPVKSLPLVL